MVALFEIASGPINDRLHELYRVKYGRSSYLSSIISNQDYVGDKET
jgi:hypothetical protein